MALTIITLDFAKIGDPVARKWIFFEDSADNNEYDGLKICAKEGSRRTKEILD